MHFLNDQERTQLKIQHRHEHDGRVRDRIKAILLYDKGWTPQQIAEALLITDQSIRNHIEDYKVSDKLKPESGGSEEKLSKEQSEQLEAHLQKHTYLYVRDIAAYVKTTFKAESIIRFFRKIEEAYPSTQKLHVFCDNAPYYRIRR
jgi:transposase